jgi:thiol-disulfide isomerase/thioredoxin
MRTFAIALALAAHAAHAADIRRLGDEPRQTVLAEIETRPFSPGLLNDLQNWSTDPLTEAAIKDKVVVILAWENDEARSLRLLPALARLERALQGEVVCLAVHGPEGWDDAAERIASGRIAVRTAHDPDGALFAALKADEHPNVYLVDRAGNLRVADIDPRDLDKAVRDLARETPDEARADLPSRLERLAQRRALTPEPQPRTNMPRPMDPNGAGPGSPVTPTPTVPPEAYLSAAWPPYNLDTASLNARNVQGRTLPVPLGNETWLTPKPERPVEEHVLVLDFWAIWCGPCRAVSPKLDALQRAHPGELMVLGVSGLAAGEKYPEDPDAITAYMRDHPVAYWHLNDLRKTVYTSLGIRAIPHVVILSTDGIVRWQGNPHDTRFLPAVEQVIAADPLLAARRASED